MEDDKKADPGASDQFYKYYGIKDDNERAAILTGMRNDLSSADYEKWTTMEKLQGLFGSVDNIKSVYDECNVSCPMWYMNKYGHLF